MRHRFLSCTSHSSAVKNGQLSLSIVLLSSLLAGIQSGCQSSAQEPNAVRDLLIDRIGWEVYPTMGDSARKCIEHRFAITNTSARDSYRAIQLCIDYYTPAGQRLGSDTTVVDTLVAPGTLIKLANQRVGTLRPGTDRTDIRVLRAEAN
jgi:hypothetical protein